MDYLVSRLKEKSTWAGIATLVAALGWKLDPEVFAAGSAAVIALVGLWEVLRKG